MREVPVGRAAVDGLVLGHWRDHDTVDQVHVAQPEGREHRRAALFTVRLHLEPVFGFSQPLRIAQAQVFVRDALAAREQRIGKLRCGIGR